MNVTHRLDKNILYIALEGRIDASNAATAEEKIFEIKRANANAQVIIDADALEYISSAGLRVILKLRKGDPSLAIINASPEVYEIFDMTGFTDMVRVEKAYRRMSVDGCEFIAKGANGAVYRYDDETIVKTYYGDNTLAEIQQERENARRAFVLGINTAIPYGIVRVGDCYGTVTELLNARSLTSIIRENPDDLDGAVDHYVNMLKTIHSVEVADGELPDMKESVLEWIDLVAGEFAPETVEKLRKLVNDVPKCNTVLHGDYHTNNIMIQNGEPILIDMDTLSMGHPVFEFAFMFNACLGFSEVDHTEIERFMGYTRVTSRKFWDKVLRKYLQTDDAERCLEVEKKASVVGYVRILRRALRRIGVEDNGAVIANCKMRLNSLAEELDTIQF